MVKALDCGSSHEGSIPFVPIMRKFLLFGLGVAAAGVIAGYAVERKLRKLLNDTATSYDKLPDNFFELTDE